MTVQCMERVGIVVRLAVNRLASVSGRPGARIVQ